jgi:hypothetical protein
VGLLRLWGADRDPDGGVRTEAATTRTLLVAAVVLLALAVVVGAVVVTILGAEVLGGTSIR